MSFETDVSRIEEIAQKLNASETSLEESIALFEEGMRLSKSLEKMLAEAKQKVEAVLSDDPEAAEIQAFE